MSGYMGIEEARWERILRWIVVTISIPLVVAFFIGLLKLSVEEEPASPVPNQARADSASRKLFIHLNNEKVDDDRVKRTEDGTFSLEKDSPTLDEARYLYSIALPMQGCRYENPKTSFNRNPIGLENFGDKYKPTQAKYMYMYTVNADMTCGDKGKISPVRIEYSVVSSDMGSIRWDIIGRIYSVSYENS